MSVLQIRPDGALDFLALGALVCRLDPGIMPFRKAHTCAMHVSGGEYNVAANLSDCFRLRAGIATAMVDYPLGQLVADRVRAMGVQPFYTRFPHDGVRGPNIATVYSDRGFGVRAPEVYYNRSDEAAAQLKPGDIDWPSIMASGVRWFHSGGIFASLSDTTPALIIEGMQAARSAGAIVSFDLNYREKLWRVAGGPQRARDILTRIVREAHVLVGNEEDLQHGLGLAGPAVSRGSALDPSPFLDMTARVAEAFPRLAVVATTLREVHSANRHSWSAVARIGGAAVVAPTCELDVFDRVGGGDGFAAGLIYGLLTNQTAEAAVRLGWAHGALVTTFPGDTTMATLEQVQAMASGEQARIRR